MIQPMPFDFVLSYNQEDMDYACSVHQKLEAAGLNGWIDRLYYYVPNQSLEKQLAKAWSMARFIIVLATGHFRDSDWCRAEYGQGLAVERELPLQQVLILYEYSDRLPEVLRGNQRFPLSSTGVEDIGNFLRERRFPAEPGPNLLLAIERWKTAALQLRECRAFVDPDVWLQLDAVEAVCSWMYEYLTGEISSSSEAVRLTLLEPNSRKVYPFDKKTILHCAFSNAIEVDCIPFQRVFYDAVLVVIQNAVAPVRETVERIIWSQLTLLACAHNQFFAEQMIEAAADLAFRAPFALMDDLAHKHFNAIDVDGLWSRGINRSRLLSRRSDVLSVLSDGRHLASPIEHALISRWQSRRSEASRLLGQLPTAERVALAGRASLLMFQRFAEEEVTADLFPHHAKLLGLSSHCQHHLDPGITLEMFYLTLVDILGRVEFSFLSAESVTRMEGRMPPYHLETLTALDAALRYILPRYVETLEIWRLRRKADVFTHEIVLNFIDHVIHPYAVLSTAHIDVTDLRREVLASLRYLGEHGTTSAQSVVELVVSELDRPLYFETGEFSGRLIMAINPSRAFRGDDPG